MKWTQMSTINWHLVFLLPTRMHSSRMRTARSLTVSRRIPRTPPYPPWEACTPPRSMHAPRKHTPPGEACTPPQRHTHTPPGNTHAPPWTEWQTGAKILPCPKLRLRAVIMDVGSKYSCLPKDKKFILLSMCKGLSFTMIKRRIITS